MTGCRNKKLPKFITKCPKKYLQQFKHRETFSKIAQKVANFRATFIRIFVAKTFQNLPNLVTLSAYILSIVFSTETAFSIIKTFRFIASQNFDFPKGKRPDFLSSQTVWPDLAKIRYFGKMLQIFGNFLRTLLVLCKNFNLLWNIQGVFGPIYIVVVNGQILRKHSRHLVKLVPKFNNFKDNLLNIQT